MRIALMSLFVNDQEQALQFYTGVLGFVLRLDIPMGAARWLTVTSPEDPEGTQLVLEPNTNPAAAAFQRALLDQGIAYTAFKVADAQAEYERLVARGVVFRQPPTPMGPTTQAVFEDTCGNLIQIFAVASPVA
jgi:catechol 2,3-dioxygenase-like lactoylglutathione lyase family enzyme